jgi:hypothetical protein
MEAQFVERAEDLLRAPFDLPQPFPMLAPSERSDHLRLQPVADAAA